MASSLILNPVASSERSRDSSRKKKKKKAAREDDRQDQDQIKWKSQAQHQVYSSKLLRALSQVRISSPESTPNEMPRRGRAVREASDTVLAMTAKGRSRWSRAILTNRLKLKFRNKHNRQKARVAGNSRTKKPSVSVLRLRGKGLPTVQRKVRLLGRLVPGCRKQPLPVILDEVTDYIPALEMQIRVLSAIVNLVSSSSSSSSGIDSST
ncbi:transcription factor bHLH147-like [Benincasa hispida]|uniref:transcription factor bHLH147-like n=1 Tax=Benincasa hispida TaxID=102211 RepID=UPI0019006060|nr:transcription factor bHLH147-like [Benincasa hispida]XP_038886886.1 transcription factor bHLH147-like [Benincasa hispida]